MWEGEENYLGHKPSIGIKFVHIVVICSLATSVCRCVLVWVLSILPEEISIRVPLRHT